MADHDNEDHGDDKQSVVTPNPIYDAEANPGKRVIRDEGVEAIDNVDIRNAIYISYLDTLKTRIQDLNTKIQSQISSDDTHPLLPFNEVGIAVLEMHVLTISYFEGVAFQFCRWSLEMDNEIAKIVIDESQADIPKDADLSERNRRVLDWHENTSTLAQYKNVMKDAGYMDGILDPLDNVQERRNTYVHHPEALIYNLDTRSDVVTVLIDCLNVVEGLDEVVDEHLPVDQSMYDVFMSGE